MLSSQGPWEQKREKRGSKHARCCTKRATTTDSQCQSRFESQSHKVPVSRGGPSAGVKEKREKARSHADPSKTRTASCINANELTALRIGLDPNRRSVRFSS